MKKILMVELWGIGDATLMTSALQGFLSDGWTVTILAKPQTRLLLQPAYPQVKFIEFDAPWTAFRGKYRLWRWPWSTLGRLLSALHRERFDTAISIRCDPRDHLLMWLAGIRRRIGFAHAFSRLFLNEPMPVHDPNAHRVEDWWKLQDRVSGVLSVHQSPHLTVDLALAEKYRAQLNENPHPIVALHCGARIAVRRWPEGYFRQLITSLREKFDFQLVLIPDPDGYGNSLHDLADHTFPELSLAELLALLSCATQVICNDSGPCHLAAALDIPVIAFFGPQRPELFRPFGDHHLVVIRDICPLRPCSDYCQFPENYCLTKLVPALACPEIDSYLLKAKRLPLKVPLS